MFKKNKLTQKISFIIGLLLLLKLFSCGFAYEKQITGNYYIIGVDSKDDISLSYKLGSGDYVGKAPGVLLEYGYNETFLVAKTKEYTNNNPAFYIIDMTKDSELAHEENFRIGPLTENEYNNAWNEKLKVQLTAVK